MTLKAYLAARIAIIDRAEKTEVVVEQVAKMLTDRTIQARLRFAGILRRRERPKQLVTRLQQT